MTTIKATIKTWLIRYLTKNLLKAPIIDEIIVIDETTKIVRFVNKKLTEEEKLALKEQAEHLQNSYLWKLMQNEIAFMVEVIGHRKAKSFDDLNFSRAMLYNLELQNKLIEKIKLLR